MIVEIVHVWTCAACGCTDESTRYKYALGAVYMRPCLPEGWTVADGETYCAKHQVEVQVIVDGKPLPKPISRMTMKFVCP